MTQADSARLTDAEIAAYRELSEQATAGPWGREKAAERMGGWEIAPLDSEGECDWSREVCATASNDDANSAFIAASRTFGPALADEVMEWRRMDAELRSELDELRAVAAFARLFVVRDKELDPSDHNRVAARNWLNRALDDLRQGDLRRHTRLSQEIQSDEYGQEAPHD